MKRDRSVIKCVIVIVRCPSLIDKLGFGSLTVRVSSYVFFFVLLLLARGYRKKKSARFKNLHVMNFPQTIGQGCAYEISLTPQNVEYIFLQMCRMNAFQNALTF